MPFLRLPVSFFIFCFNLSRIQIRFFLLSFLSHSRQKVYFFSTYKRPSSSSSNSLLSPEFRFFSSDFYRNLTLHNTALLCSIKSRAFSFLFSYFFSFNIKDSRPSETLIPAAGLLRILYSLSLKPFKPQCTELGLVFLDPEASL